jgi:tripartite-type tricarboxylate transporter receptor subunit TctC
MLARLTIGNHFHGPNLNAILVKPEVRTQLADLGASLLPASAADFGTRIDEETQKWDKVIRFAGIKPE